MSAILRPRGKIHTNPLKFKNKFFSTGYTPPQVNEVSNVIHFFQDNPETVKSVEAREKALDIKRRLERLNAKAFTDKEALLHFVSKAQKRRQQLLTLAKIKQYLSQRAESEGNLQPGIQLALRKSLEDMYKSYLKAEAAKQGKTSSTLEKMIALPDTAEGMMKLLDSMYNPKPLVKAPPQREEKKDEESEDEEKQTHEETNNGPNRQPAGQIAEGNPRTTDGKDLAPERSEYDEIRGKINEIFTTDAEKRFVEAKFRSLKSMEGEMRSIRDSMDRLSERAENLRKEYGNQETLPANIQRTFERIKTQYDDHVKKFEEVKKRWNQLNSEMTKWVESKTVAEKDMQDYAGWGGISSLKRKRNLGDYDSRESGMGILAPPVKRLHQLLNPRYNKPEITQLPLDRVQEIQNELSAHRNRYREEKKEETGVVPTRDKIKEAFPELARPFNIQYFSAPSGLSINPLRSGKLHTFK